MKIYTAKLSNGQRVVNVFASNMAEAREEVFKELNLNPSRRAYLARWQKDGRIVVPEHRDI
jgi:hypothetical protein